MCLSEGSAAYRRANASAGNSQRASALQRLTMCIRVATIACMHTVLQTEEFVNWLDDLKDKRARVRISARLRHVEAGNLGDWSPIEGDVSELRIDYGPGYRLYFVRRGRIIIVMLNAGDKSSQKRDVRHALKLAAELGVDL